MTYKVVEGEFLVVSPEWLVAGPAKFLRDLILVDVLQETVEGALRLEDEYLLPLLRAENWLDDAEEHAEPRGDVDEKETESAARVELSPDLHGGTDEESDLWRELRHGKATKVHNLQILTVVLGDDFWVVREERSFG